MLGLGLQICRNARPTLATISAPENTVAPVITSDGDLANPVPGDPLSCTTGTWTGSPTFGYRWKHGSDDSNATGTGATTNSYTVDATDEGDTLYCRVTATNGAGSQSADSNESGEVTPEAIQLLPVTSLHAHDDFQDGLLVTWTDPATVGEGIRVVVRKDDVEVANELVAEGVEQLTVTESEGSYDVDVRNEGDGVTTLDSTTESLSDAAVILTLTDIAELPAFDAAFYIYSAAHPFVAPTAGVYMMITGGTGWVPAYYEFTGNWFPAHDNTVPVGLPITQLNRSPSPGVVENTGGQGRMIALPERRVIWEGDSLTANDFFVTLSMETMRDNLGITIDAFLRWSNISTGGETVADMITQVATQVAPLYDADTCNVIVLLGGTNDLYTGASAATLISRLHTLGAAYKALGFTVVIMTITSRSLNGTPPTFNADRATVNADIRATVGADWDYIIDLAADSRIGYDGAENDTDYFYPGDGVHYNAGGGVVVSELAVPVIQPLLAG